MQEDITFALNATEYFAAVIAYGEHAGQFCWSNDRGEEGKAVATLLDAQQDAIEWEATRRERYEGSEEEAIDARNRHYNHRTDDARYSEQGE